MKRNEKNISGANDGPANIARGSILNTSGPPFTTKFRSNR